MSFASHASELGYDVSGEPQRGGSGVVYQATHRASGTRVALKVLNPGFDLARLEREAAILARIQSPHVPRLVELVTIDGQPTLVVEWVEGVALAELVRTNAPLPEARARHIFEQIAAGLDEVHAAGVVHRDLSAANILIGVDDHVSLIDFGLGRGADTSTVTVEGTLAGTPRYLAPETITGAEPLPQTDQYAAAVLLQELLTGTWPYGGADSFASALHHHLHSAPVPLGERDPMASASIESAILRALDKDADNRFSSMSDFVLALDQPPADDAPRRSLAVGTTIAVVIIGLGIWAVFRDDGTSVETQESETATVAVETTSSPTTAPTETVPETTTTLDDRTGRVAVTGWDAGLAESLTCNLMTEADFETIELPENFYADASASVVERSGLGGTGGLEVGKPNVFGLYGEIIPTEPDTAYILSANVRIDGDLSVTRMSVSWLDTDFQLIDGVESTLDLIGLPPGQYSLVAAPSPSTASYAVPSFYKDQGEGVLYVDEVVLARADADCTDTLLG